MGNGTLSTKQQILSILRKTRTPVSGNQLAGECGISRTSVWKAVQSLSECGYIISSEKKGYLLVKDNAESLYPWEFGKEENAFSHFAVTESTMHEARRIASESTDKSDSTRIITADAQTQGQGHKGHSWTTAENSLAYTIINHDKVNLAESSRLMMAAQITLVELLRSLSDKAFFLRWPNDIWSPKGKIAGILDEVNSLGSECKWINLGIGLNFKAAPDMPNTDSAFSPEVSITRHEFLQQFVHAFDKQKQIAFTATSELEDHWNSLCSDCGKEVRLENGQSSIFYGLNSYGWGRFSSQGAESLIPPGKISFAKQ